MKKNFVLDTNVILHDYSCIDHFEDNDIYLPITVLEELDRFKKGSEQIHYNARAFVRRLDERGMLYVVVGDHYQRRVANSFPERIPDHRILSAAVTVAERHPDMLTILVTKDINMRMKARALGIPVEDYFTDKVTDFVPFSENETV